MAGSRAVRRTFLFFSVLACLAARGRAAEAEPRAERVSMKAPTAWCASEPGIETLSEGICHIDGGEKDGRRTLVVFLHGAIARDVTWQWTQERALLRQAQQSGFHAIFPRAPLGPGGYAWPGSAAAQEEVEDGLVASWTAARKKLEAREGKPFDEVFVMGFSSGAYYVSSLALRRKLKVEGYAVFAGGSGWGGGPSEPGRKLPVFVGVCADDKQTAAHSRAFGATLAALGFPHRVEEQHVGHMFGDAHVAHAVAWLRSVDKPRGVR
jgi:predicted esterase